MPLEAVRKRAPRSHPARARPAPPKDREKALSLTRRQRKLIGAFAMLAFVIFYALVAMALAQARPLQEASKLIQALSYAIMGTAWVIPMFPLIKWMEGRGERNE